MLKQGVKVFLYDPLRRPDLLSGVLERVLSLPNTADGYAREIVARLVYGEPTVACFLATQGDFVVGHLIGQQKGTIFHIDQCDVDRRFPRTIDIVLEKLDTWCKDHGASEIQLKVDPERHPVEIWHGEYKRYRFTPGLYTVSRKVR